MTGAERLLRALAKRGLKPEARPSAVRLALLLDQPREAPARRR